jgi:hypothetical protein
LIDIFDILSIRTRYLIHSGSVINLLWRTLSSLPGLMIFISAGIIAEALVIVMICIDLVCFLISLIIQATMLLLVIVPGYGLSPIRMSIYALVLDLAPEEVASRSNSLPVLMQASVALPVKLKRIYITSLTARLDRIPRRYRWLFLRSG